VYHSLNSCENRDVIQAGIILCERIREDYGKMAIRSILNYMMQARFENVLANLLQSEAMQLSGEPASALT